MIWSSCQTVAYARPFSLRKFNIPLNCHEQSRVKPPPRQQFAFSSKVSFQTKGSAAMPESAAKYYPTRHSWRWLFFGVTPSRLFSARSARDRRSRTNQQTTAQPRAPPVSPLSRSVMHVASNPRDLQSLPRFQNSCALPPIFVSYRPVSAAEARQSDDRRRGSCTA